jgi:hypothetical protein
MTAGTAIIKTDNSVKGMRSHSHLCVGKIFHTNPKRSSGEMIAMSPIHGAQNK